MLTCIYALISSFYRFSAAIIYAFVTNNPSEPRAQWRNKASFLIYKISEV